MQYIQQARCGHVAGVFGNAAAPVPILLDTRDGESTVAQLESVA